MGARASFQLSLPFAADAPGEKARRRRAAPRPTPRTPRLRPSLPPTAMFEDRRCGFCGAQTTVLGEAGLCAGCGAILVREER